MIYITGEENATLVYDVFRSGSEDFIGKDSASLLRLKIKLDELVIRRANRISEKKRQKRLVIAGITVAFMYFIMQYLLLR